ncbi:pectinesterase [Trifolium repens]|nr:pectinesterase [Trifolium repens]
MGKYGPKMDGIITAQKRKLPNDTSGFVFKNCKISGKGGKAILGRAMGAYARVIIVVRPEGWNPNTYAGHEANLTFVEEGNRGPGANKSQRMKWMKHLSGAGLDKFKKISFIDEDGWIAKLPKTIFG